MQIGKTVIKTLNDTFNISIKYRGIHFILFESTNMKVHHYLTIKISDQLWTEVLIRVRSVRHP
jgi:hypothetical protein